MNAMRSIAPRIVAAAVVAAGLSLVSTAAVAEAVGTAGAANTRAAGTNPGGAQKLIEIGEQVVRDEKIETSASGSVQVVFIDKTTLNIGPNSLLVIDKFVFNPATSTGAMALTLGRGVLRVVGGQATHSGAATIATPVATIGIRGGIVTLSHCPDGMLAGQATGKHRPHGLAPQFASLCDPPGTHAVLHFGRMDVTANGVTQTVLRPGFGVSVTTQVAATPSPPAKASQAEVDADNALLTSKGTQKGGAHSKPTDAIATRDGLGGYNQSASTAIQPRQGQTTGRLATVGVSGTTSATIGNSIQQGVAGSAAGSAGSQPPTGPAPKAYVLTTTAGAGSAVPFLTASFVTAGNAQVSRIYGYRAGGVDGNGQADTLSRNFQTSLVINGAGASQTSTFAVMTAAIGKANGGYVQGGSFLATSRFDAQSCGCPAFGAATSTTNPDGTRVNVPTDANGMPNGAYRTSQNSLVFDTSTGAVATRPALASEEDFGSTYRYSQTVTPVATPKGLGANHPDAVLQGYVGAIGQTPAYDASGSAAIPPAYIITNRTGSPGDVSIALYGNSSRLSAAFNVRNASATGTPMEFRNASYRFGIPDDTATTTYDASAAAYVDLTHFAAKSQRVLNGFDGAATETSTVNGKALDGKAANGLPAERSGLMLVNGAVFDHGSSFCKCDYTQWGLWSADTIRNDAANGLSYSDVTGIAYWVAGKPAAASDVNSAIANNVTATYTGHVAVSIANGAFQPSTGQFPSVYVAGAGFSNAVSFGTRSGVVNVQNLDGASYAGTVRFAANPTLFSGSLAGTAGGRMMGLNGSFFSGGATSPLGEMGGSVIINGRNYLGSGIFAASSAKLH